MQKIINKINMILPLGLALFTMGWGNVAWGQVTCTATPDCNSLGYTQTTCEGGGIRCPFDAGKMFCIKDGSVSEFKFANAISKYHVVYSDGVTSTSWFPSRDPIGIVFYVHPNRKLNHGLVMSLEQFPAQGRAEAVKQCAAFVTKGTNVGDWHLPDIGELSEMSVGSERILINQLDMFQTYLGLVPGAKMLGLTSSYWYRADAAAVDHFNGKTYLVGVPNANYYQYDTYLYWSSSDQPNNDANFYADISSATGLTSVSGGAIRYGHFRCVAQF